MMRFAPALFASACLMVGGATAEPVNLVYSNAWNGNDLQTGIVADEWIRRIEEATEGRVKIRHISGGALLNAEGTLEGVRKGVADAGAVVVNYHTGELPIAAALSGALDVEYGNKLDLMGITAVTQKLLEEFPEFQEEFESQGIKPLLWVPAGQYTVIGNVDIETLEDFEGKKIRTFGSSLPQFVDAIGGVPVAVDFGELYTSLQTGVIDALITNPTAIIPAGLDEVSTSVTTTGPGLGTSLAGPTVNYAINLDSWNKISEEDRESIERISKEMLPVGAEMMMEGTAKAYEDLEAAGIKINHLSESDTAQMAEMIPDFLALVAERLNERGLPGDEIIGRYKELADDYASGEWEPTY